MVRNLPAIQETQVRSLGQEDPWRRGYTLQHSSGASRQEDYGKAGRSHRGGQA